jgi:hypothetical protein
MPHVRRAGQVSPALVAAAVRRDQATEDGGEMSTLVIEDDDGFRTEWPWPDDKLALANASFIEMFEVAHDRLREETA